MGVLIFYLDNELKQIQSKKFLKQKPNVGPGSYENKDFLDQRRNKVIDLKEAFFNFILNVIDL